MVSLPPISPDGWPSLVAGGALFLLAVWLMYLDFRNQVHRAFSLLLVLWSLHTALAAFTMGSTAGAVVASSYRGYLLISLPFAALWFALTFHRRYVAHPEAAAQGLRRAASGLVILGAAVSFLLLYVLDHDLFTPWSPASGVIVFEPMWWTAVGFIALAFARAYAAAAPFVSRRSLLLGSAAFLVPSVHVTLFMVCGFLFDLSTSQTPLYWIYHTFVIVGLFLSGWTVWHVFRHGLRHTDAAAAASERRFLVLVASAAGTSLLSFAMFRLPLVPGDISASFARFLVPFWIAWLPVLMAYALLKCRLFGFDRNVRWTIKSGTIVATFISVGFVVGESAQHLFTNIAAPSFADRAPYIGVVAAGLLIFFLHPIQRVAERLATRAVPGGKPLADMDGDERLGVYREQVELAWLDGNLRTKERLLLDRLRDQLSIPPEAAFALESEVVRMVGRVTLAPSAAPMRAPSKRRRPPTRARRAKTAPNA